MAKKTASAPSHVPSRAPSRAATSTPSSRPAPSSGSRPAPSSGAAALRILLVEDHVMVREALRLLLESQPELCVVGEADNRAAALALAAQEQPDVTLLDLRLGGENSLEWLPDLLSVARVTQVIVLTASGNVGEYRRALDLGARGVLLKEQASTILLEAIERVRAGHTYVDPTVLTRVLATLSATGASADANVATAETSGRASAGQAAGAETDEREAARIATLTEREREVIALVAETLTNQQIAERLFVSERTVRHHLNAIFTKLGVRGRSQLLIYAYRHGLNQPPS